MLSEVPGGWLDALSRRDDEDADEPFSFPVVFWNLLLRSSPSLGSYLEEVRSIARCLGCLSKFSSCSRLTDASLWGGESLN